VGDDAVAGAFEVLVDALVEALLRPLAHVAGLDEFDEGRGGALDEERRRRLQRLDEALRQAQPFFSAVDTVCDGMSSPIGVGIATAASLKRLLRQRRRDEEAVRMRVHVGAVHPRLRVVHELRPRQVVEHRGER
jgi:hypothetical protein